MKKITVLLTLLVTIFTLSLLFSCKSTSTYTVIYESKGGSLVASVTVYEGDKVDEPADPILAYYDFQGWYTSEDYTAEFDFDSEVNANITLYAKWTPKSFIVTYETGFAGATVADETVIYPAAATEPAVPVRPSYNFIEWKLDGQAYDFDATVTTNITLTASWTCDYQFTLTNDEIYITGYTGETETIDMPDSLDGYPIVGIAEGLFLNNEELTEISLPSSLESISANLFYGCDSLLEITLPDSVTTIGAAAFKNSAMSLINFGYSLTSIGANAFENCRGLLGVVLPESLLSIGNAAFKNCSTLTSIIIGTSVTTIGEYAFYNCQNLLNVILPDSVTSIGKFAFSRCISLASVFIGDGITIIPENGFDSCISLKSIVFGDNLTEIRQYAFLYCTSLTSITIPDTVTLIASYAFSGCSGLLSLYIGSGVETMGAMAFAGCTSLMDITINALTAPTASNDVFLNIPVNHSVLVDSQAEGYTGGLWDIINLDIFYTVNFVIGYESGSNPDAQIVAYMGNATEPLISSRTGYTFLGWYRDSNKTLLFDFDTKITESRTLYGKWSEIYEFDITNNTITINGFVDGISMEVLNVPAQLSTDQGYLPVVAIASGAFKENTTLTHVTLPDSVVTVGDEAFSGCVNLESVRLGSATTTLGASAFMNCAGLELMTLPGSVTTIGASTFENCTGLLGITIGNNLNSIGNYAFKNCSHLQSMVLPGNLKTIGNEAFSGCVVMSSINLPSGMTGIGEYAFENCAEITAIAIPLSINTIAQGTFYGCAKLASVTMGLVTTIGSEAFYGAAALNSIILPISLVSLGGYAFYGCESLTSINIPLVLVNINEYTFYGCSALASLTINAPIISVGQYAFYNSALTSFDGKNVLTSIGQYAFAECDLMTSVTLPDSVLNIGNNAFENTGITSIDLSDNDLLVTISGSVFKNCASLASVSLPDYVISIGDSAFEGCAALVIDSLPDTLITLGSSAFKGCASIEGMTLPNSLTVIPVSAFEGCSSLKSVTFGNALTKIDEYAFRNCGLYTVVEIPATIETINGGAFIGNSNLYTVIILSSAAPGIDTLLNPLAFDLIDELVIYVAYGSTGYGIYSMVYEIRNFYIVTFNMNGAESQPIESVRLLEGETGAHMEAPAEPVRTGYTFEGWLNNDVTFDFGSNVTTNMNLVADFQIITYTVTFDTGAGTTVDPIQDQTINYGEKVATVEEPTLEGYNFLGWYNGEELYNFDSDVYEDIDLVAEFEIKVLTVTFDLNGGEAVGLIEELSVNYGDYAIEPSPDPEINGGSFAGWYLEGNLFDFETYQVTEDITLLAEYVL
jgi:uncharacterized repeat protein (TIGR02543 family)